MLLSLMRWPKRQREGIYYQLLSIYAEIPNKKTLKAFTEVENDTNVKTYNTPKELWQEIEQELEPEGYVTN